MNKYTFQIKVPAYKTVTVEAPTAEIAYKWADEGNVDYHYGYQMQDGWEIDDMCGEVEVYEMDDGKLSGITRLADEADADYTVDDEWIENNGYTIQKSYIKNDQ